MDKREHDDTHPEQCEDHLSDASGDEPGHRGCLTMTGPSPDFTLRAPC
jgi:hypothetical protein